MDGPTHAVAQCKRLQNKLNKQLVKTLASRAKNSHLLKGASSLEEVPILCFRAKNRKSFNLLKQSRNLGLLTYVWPTFFGRLISFSLSIGRNEFAARLFLSIDKEISKEIIRSGRLHFFVTYDSKSSPVFEADFNSGHNSLRELESFCASETIYGDDELAFWSLMNPASGKNWQTFLSQEDAYFINRANVAAGKINRLQNLYSQEYALNLVLEKSSDMTLLQEKSPFMFEILLSITDASSNIAKTVKLIERSLEDPALLEEMISRRFSIFGAVEGLPDDCVLVFDAFFSFFQIISSVTNNGTRRLWLDGAKIPMRANFIELDWRELAKCDPNFWYTFEKFDPFSIYPFDIGHFLAPNESEIDDADIFSSLRLDCSEKDAELCSAALLAEAEENSQWSIPWGAAVQVNLEECEFLYFYQIDFEIYFVFRGPSGYLYGAINTRTGNFAFPNLFNRHPDTTTNTPNVSENTEARSAIKLLVCSVVRDFLVVEEREKVFSTRSKQPMAKKFNHGDNKLNVVYLPRVSYLNAEAGPLLQSFTEWGEKTRHKVQPHLRRSQNSSRAQQWLAKSYGIEIPRGFTFVRSHSRGGLTESKRAIYRSKSASLLLYTQVERSDTKPRWFEFEKDVSTLMADLGYEVDHKAASRNGDGGVDVYAHHKGDDESWIIQCKCFSLDRKIGPNYIRELIGSLAAYPAGTRGMFVTTTTFTEGALDLAAKHSIKTIDGERFTQARAGSASRKSLK